MLAVLNDESGDELRNKTNYILANLKRTRTDMKMYAQRDSSAALALLLPQGFQLKSIFCFTEDSTLSTDDTTQIAK